MPVRPAMNTHTSSGSGPSGSHTTSPRMSVSSAPPSGSVTAMQPFAGRHRRQRHAARLDRDLLPAQAAGGVIDRDVRPAVGPAAAEREIEAQAEPTRRLGAVAHGVEEGRRQERMVDEAAAAIVGDQRIDRLHFDAAEAGVVHRLQLAVEALRRDRRRRTTTTASSAARPRTAAPTRAADPPADRRAARRRSARPRAAPREPPPATAAPRLPASPCPPRSASRRREEAYAVRAPHPVPHRQARAGARAATHRISAIVPTTSTNPNIQSLRKCVRFMQMTR